MNVKSMLEDSRVSVLDWARREKMPQAIADLSRINSKFDTWEDFVRLSRWANQAQQGVLRRVNMEEVIKEHHIDRDYADWRERQSSTGRALSNALLDIDLDSVASSLTIPALFISGRLDTIVAEQTVRRDYGNYKGSKQLVLLEDSHHLPFVDQPDALVKAISEFLMHQVE